MVCWLCNAVGVAITRPSSRNSSNASSDGTTTAPAMREAISLAAWASKSASAAISTAPLSRIDRSRWRPIQPTPRNPTRGRVGSLVLGTAGSTDLTGFLVTHASPVVDAENPRPVLFHGNDTDRSRADFETKQEVQRHAQAMRQRSPDDVGVADQRNGHGRMALAQPLQQRQHPGLNLNHRLAVGNARA